MFYHLISINEIEKKQRFFSAHPLRYLVYLKFEPHVV